MVLFIFKLRRGALVKSGSELAVTQSLSFSTVREPLQASPVLTVASRVQCLFAPHDSVCSGSMSAYMVLALQELPLSGRASTQWLFFEKCTQTERDHIFWKVIMRVVLREFLLVSYILIVRVGLRRNTPERVHVQFQASAVKCISQQRQSPGFVGFPVRIRVSVVSPHYSVGY